MRAISARCWALKGPVMKAAQILSTVPDRCLLNTSPNCSSCRRIPLHGWAFVKRRMASELGLTGGTFADFEHEQRRRLPGQVHRRRHAAAGWPANCNTPDMASAVEADLQQLKIAWRCSGVTTR
jgi:hypothetical protein